EAGDVVTTDFDFAGMDPGAHADVVGGEGVSDRPRTIGRGAGTVERGDEAVAHGLDLATAKASDLDPHALVVAVEQVAPGAVAELGGAAGGAHEVGETHRCET